MTRGNTMRSLLAALLCLAFCAQAIAQEVAISTKQ